MAGLLWWANGYAIGFDVSGLLNKKIVTPVIYDGDEHRNTASQLAVATVQLFREGLEENYAASPEQWTAWFSKIWHQLLISLAPMFKDPTFAAEKECRMLHQLQDGNHSKMRFRQKTALMSRHLPLTFSSTNADSSELSIVEVMVGPSRHKEISRASVAQLMRQNGYEKAIVSASSVPFQLT